MRLRAHCLCRLRLLGEVTRVAARIVTAAIRTLTGERDVAVGIVACLQTHGSRANWHPHRHLLVTDGGFWADGICVSWPVHETARLTEAFRRAVLRLLVRLDLFDEGQAAGMLTWPHSGFHVHSSVWVKEDDRAFATRLARYCARNPDGLTYDRAAKAVTYRSEKSEGPTAGTETADPLEFLRAQRATQAPVFDSERTCRRGERAAGGGEIAPGTEAWWAPAAPRVRERLTLDRTRQLRDEGAPVAFLAVGAQT